MRPIKSNILWKELENVGIMLSCLKNFKELG